MTTQQDHHHHHVTVSSSTIPHANTSSNEQDQPRSSFQHNIKDRNIVSKVPKSSSPYSSPKRKSVIARQLSEATVRKGTCLDKLLMGLFAFVFGVFTFVILAGDYVLIPRNRSDWCHAAQMGYQWKDYENIDAIRDPCYYQRTIYLLGFNIFECDFGRRMICAVLLGAAIGWERKAADRPAGIRTMSLVCLGSATFTMGGQFAFRSSTMGWDAARVSAAIPSGVGFLGSALIWKEATGPKGPDQKNHVHGITTAASVWLSASVGIGVGGALYVMSIWTVVLTVFVLRLGPHFAFQDYEELSAESELDGSNKSCFGITKQDSSFEAGASGKKYGDTWRAGFRNADYDQAKSERERAQSLFSSRHSRASIAKDVKKETMRMQKLQAPSLHSD